MAGKPIYDVTALGSYVYVLPKTGSISNSHGGIRIEDFPSESTPVNIDEFDSGTLEMDVNGEFYRKASLKPITVSLSLIANSESDREMNAVALKNTGYEYNLFDMTIHYRNGIGIKKDFETVAFYNGILRSVTKGFSIDGSGKIETRVYVFQFPPPGFEGKSTGNTISLTDVDAIDAQTYLQRSMSLA